MFVSDCLPDPVLTCSWWFDPGEHETISVYIYLGQVSQPGCGRTPLRVTPQSLGLEHGTSCDEQSGVPFDVMDGVSEQLQKGSERVCGSPGAVLCLHH